MRRFSRCSARDDFRGAVGNDGKRCRFAALCLLVLASALGASCGLEDYAFLYPPSSASKSNAVFTFTNSTKNSSSSLVGYGFKILYKFFPNPDSAKTAIAEVDSLYKSYPTSIYSKMLGKSYRTLLFSPSYEDALRVDSDKTSEFSLQIDFTSAYNRLTNATVQISQSLGTTIGSTPALPCTVYRSVTGESGIGFSPEDLAATNGFSDLLSGQYSVENKTFMVLFVLAYSFDVSTWQEIYSEPKPFGGESYIELSVAGT